MPRIEKTGFPGIIQLVCGDWRRDEWGSEDMGLTKAQELIIKVFLNELPMRNRQDLDLLCALNGGQPLTQNQVAGLQEESPSAVSSRLKRSQEILQFPWRKRYLQLILLLSSEELERLVEEADFLIGFSGLANEYDRRLKAAHQPAVGAVARDDIGDKW